jgi:hypothetical protein
VHKLWSAAGGRGRRTLIAAAVIGAVFAAAAYARHSATLQIGGSDVNAITGTETWAHVTQSEDQIAVHGSTVVVAYNDSKDIASNPLVVEGMSVSTNGGVSFTRLSPSPFASGHGNSFGDPFVVYNPKLSTWFAGGLADGCGGLGLGVWTSANGTAWAAGVCAHSGSADDRPSLAVDTTPASPFYGRMYLIYNDFNLANSPLRSTYSDDGVTWSSPITLASSATPVIRGLRVAVAPDGTVVAAGEDENGGGFNARSEYVYRSTNGGVSFGSQIILASGFATPGDALSSSNPFNTKFNPIWRNYGSGDLAIGSGGVAIEAYAAHGSGADGGDIYVVRSANNGTSWGLPVRIDGDAGAHSQWMPSITAGGSLFFVAWYDRRNTTNGVNYERWGTYSTDAGVTWSAPDRISDILIPEPEQPDPNIQPEYAGDYMRDAFQSSVFYDAWTDGRTTVMDPTGAPHNQQDVFVDRITVSPTAVEVAGLTARRTLRGVALTWRTGDIRLLGFDVWRAGVRITPRLILAGASGGTYRFVDRRPLRRAAVYRLQLVGLDGATKFAASARA